MQAIIFNDVKQHFFFIYFLYFHYFAQSNSNQKQTISHQETVYKCFFRKVSQNSSDTNTQIIEPEYPPVFCEKDNSRNLLQSKASLRRNYCFTDKHGAVIFKGRDDYGVITVPLGFQELLRVLNMWSTNHRPFILTRVTHWTRNAEPWKVKYFIFKLTNLIFFLHASNVMLIFFKLKFNGFLWEIWQVWKLRTAQLSFYFAPFLVIMTSIISLSSENDIYCLVIMKKSVFLWKQDSRCHHHVKNSNKKANLAVLGFRIQVEISKMCISLPPLFR